MPEISGGDAIRSRVSVSDILILQAAEFRFALAKEAEEGWMEDVCFTRPRSMTGLARRVESHEGRTRRIGEVEKVLGGTGFGTRSLGRLPFVPSDCSKQEAKTGRRDSRSFTIVRRGGTVDRWM